jgi:tetratricopeptide (TPR) repeat protein
MIMNKSIIRVGVSIVFCMVGIMLWRSNPSTGQSLTRNLGPDVPPQQRSAYLKRESFALSNIGRLDREAIDAMNAGQYAEAESDARQSVSIGVASGRGQDILAAALDAQGKTQEALLAYQAIFAEGDVSAANELPYALLLLKSGQWAQAVEVYNRQLPYNSVGDGALMQEYGDFTPYQPRPMAMEAAIHLGLGLELNWYEYHGTYQERIQQAQAHFQKALAVEPDAPLANYYVGYGLQRMGHWQEAQAAFKKAAALDQNNGDVKAAAEAALAGR